MIHSGHNQVGGFAVAYVFEERRCDPQNRWASILNFR